MSRATFRRADSESEVPPTEEESEPPVFSNSVSVEFNKEKGVEKAEEENMKEKRVRRRSVRRSVNDEEKSDADGSPREDYKVEIMRRLMKKFSLEDTVDYYRHLNSAEYAINPTNFSLDSSLHAKQLRKRLKHLLGSEMVKVNDKTFMEYVETKLKEEEQMVMERREEERVETERQRMRKLLSEGHITAKEFKSGKLEEESGKASRRSNKKFKSSTPNKLKTKKVRKRSRTKSSISGNGSNAETDKMDHDYFARSISAMPNPTYRTRLEMGNSLHTSSSVCDVESQMSRISKARDETSTDSGICDSADDLRSPMSPQPRKSSDGTSVSVTRSVTPTPRQRGYSDVSSDADEHRGRFGYRVGTDASKSREKRFKDPLFQKLKTEKSVEGMYDLAERILPVDRPRSYFEEQKISKQHSRKQ